MKLTADLLRPIKAPNEQLEFSDPRIRYPMFGSIKYDGFRCTVIPGRGFRSPTMLEFGNKQIPHHFRHVYEICQSIPFVLDGEIWHPDIHFSALSSRLRAHNGDLSGVEYHIFDILSIEDWNDPKREKAKPYNARLAALKFMFAEWKPHYCKLVEQILVMSPTGAEDLYASALAAGYEGLMLRAVNGPYKRHRCTHNESNLLKFKKFVTIDAKIVAVNQRRILKSDTLREHHPFDELKRVHTQDSYTLDEAVGSFDVELEDGKITSVNLGRGFSYTDRQALWAACLVNPSSLIGKHVEFKYQPHGTKTLPRIGSVTRFRPDLD